jgi:hypothetical protein
LVPSLAAIDIDLAKAKLGADHPDTLVMMDNLGTAYRDAGRLAEALLTFEQELKPRQSQAGLSAPRCPLCVVAPRP